MDAPRPTAPFTLAAGALSGLLLAAGTAPIGLGLLCFVGLVPLLRVIDEGATVRHAAAAAGAGGVIFFACALAWACTAGFPLPVLALLAGYVCTLAAGWAVLGACLAWLRERDRALFFTATPLLWIGFEFARSLGEFGYPWHQLAHGLADHPAFLQLAAFGGALAVSLHVAAVNCALTAARTGGMVLRSCACALFLAPLALAARPLATVSDRATIAAIQPVVTAPANGARLSFDAHLGDLLDYTERALEQSDPDLVVWPEAAYEVPVLPAGDLFLGSLALHYERPLLVGARRLVPGSPPSLFNTAVLARTDGTTRFAGDKVHPVPLYERAPRSPLALALADGGLWQGRFAPGERAGVVSTPAGAVGILMCFDSSFPGLARDLRRRGARLLVELSNESLTGPWSARHHARVSRLRAIETGLPLIRVSNTGPSEWVDARGRVHARIGAGQAGWHAASIEMGGAAPPFVRFGSTATFIAAAVPIVPVSLRRRRRRSLSQLSLKGRNPCSA